MKFLIVFVALFAVALARPDGAEVIRDESDVQPNGYKFDVETSDGFKHNAEATLENEGSDHEDLEVRGTYSYIGDDGQTYTVTYTAGVDGFVAVGDHIPKVQEV